MWKNSIIQFGVESISQKTVAADYRQRSNEFDIAQFIIRYELTQSCTHSYNLHDEAICWRDDGALFWVALWTGAVFLTNHSPSIICIRVLQMVSGLSSRHWTRIENDNCNWKHRTYKLGGIPFPITTLVISQIIQIIS